MARWLASHRLFHPHSLLARSPEQRDGGTTSLPSSQKKNKKKIPSVHQLLITTTPPTTFLFPLAICFFFATAQVRLQYHGHCHYHPANQPPKHSTPQKIPLYAPLPYHDQATHTPSTAILTEVALGEDKPARQSEAKTRRIGIRINHADCMHSNRPLDKAAHKHKHRHITYTARHAQACDMHAWYWLVVVATGICILHSQCVASWCIKKQTCMCEEK